jgi:hypothetical protein
LQEETVNPSSNMDRSKTEREIQQAIEDYRTGRFGEIQR